jgi:hypothetical protein
MLFADPTRPRELSQQWFNLSDTQKQEATKINESELFPGSFEDWKRVDMKK